ncbi:universal stress protein [Dietzia alimentaria]|uniref:universal stress protein n=1 Tax=Dietzia alimentaria TaxID=665550 RepID=UPI00029A4E44|nr:universal stress protein [Dietzia alimentaria]
MSSTPVIVGVDGGQDSVRALRWAAEHARAIDAPLQVVAAYEIPTQFGPYGMAAWENPTELEKRAKEVLADTVREALGSDASVEQYVVQGHPAEALVDGSARAQLLVVGSRGRGGFAGLLLGSVSQHVVAHARCPVVVMPRNASD